MAARSRCVVLGAGVGGHFAVEALRKAGFDGAVTLVGAEGVRPYDRPPLSKAFLQGAKGADDLFFRPPEFYRDLDVELLPAAPAETVDVAGRRLRLADGDEIPYDALLIVTGASPIRLRLPGFDLPGVHYLRSLADGEALRADLDRAERVLVVGAGFIGSEVAACARVLGRAVTLVDLLEAPMVGALGDELGRLYAGLHRSHGVELRMGSGVVELRGQGRVEEAVLAGGERVACDLVVVGVGVRPETRVVAGTPVAVGRGILVDEYGATSVPGIYAAGDVAEWVHPGLGVRLLVEHFDNAGMQAAAAARAIAGQPEPYAPVPSFWSDQYDTTLQYYGYPLRWDAVVLRGEPESPSVTAFYLAEGRVTGAAMLNRPREHRPARRLVAARAAIDPAVLADPATDLRALSRQFQGE
ncbi:MAG TPA: FAD-dependent oxidoreductase [Thermomicrobiaceae bacterium]|nr:FAD-dependent oxidoreductase [Thermomicrobiaceae bacterium]